LPMKKKTREKNRISRFTNHPKHAPKIDSNSAITFDQLIGV